MRAYSLFIIALILLEACGKTAGTGGVSYDPTKPFTGSGTPDLAKSTISLSVARGLPADGSSKATIDVKVVDSAGNPLKDQKVTIQSEPSNGISISSPTASTDDSGIVEFKVSSTVEATYTISANINYQKLISKAVLRTGPIFNPPSQYWKPLPSNPTCFVRTLVTGDLNNDSFEDLVILRSCGGGAKGLISTFINQKDGTFLQSTEVVTKGINPDSIAVGNLDEDKNLDVIVSYYYSIITDKTGLFMGAGDGSLKPESLYNLTGGNGGYPIFVGLAKMNLDSHVDLLVLYDSDASFNNTMEIFNGNSNGTFSFMGSYSTQIPHPMFISIDDFDRDGVLDVAVAANIVTNVYSVEMLRGTSSTSTPPTCVVTPVLNTDCFDLGLKHNAVGKQPIAIASGDLNNDGKLDIVTANSGTSNLSLLMGNGDLNFQDAVSLSTPFPPTAMAAADITGDGNIDLIVTNTLDKRVYIFLGDGKGNFPVRNDLIQNIGSIYSVVVQDFNNDGKPDLAIVNENNPAIGGVSIYLAK